MVNMSLLRRTLNLITNSKRFNIDSIILLGIFLLRSVPQDILRTAPHNPCTPTRTFYFTETLCIQHRYKSVLLLQ
jgi:hypothetical protein